MRCHLHTLTLAVGYVLWRTVGPPILLSALKTLNTPPPPPCTLIQARNHVIMRVPVTAVVRVLSLVAYPHYAGPTPTTVDEWKTMPANRF